ncbi:MAG: CCA tRNA nucleotidyltransferase [Clostridiales bacterium]|jgi:tRNA nucleotidyltransferase (CCA-adding enzyme)|nr:CCA tRNA nucleotidyltransferase [Clostridiales bacterium]
MKIEIPQYAWNVIDALNASGYDAYVVGGCVRDSVLGVSAKDWDIATSAKPDEVKKLFKRTADTGLRHGTVTVLSDGGLDRNAVEVTTFRCDGKYSDHRRPDSVAFTEKLENDLARRDFTVNAIAYHPAEGYIDPFNGMADIKSRVIRGVGNPAARFREDALRMMRAVRFSATLGFDIEKSVVEAIIENASLISRVSVERARDEIVKTLMSKNAMKIKLFSKYGLLKRIDERADAYARENSLFEGLSKSPCSARLPLLLMNMQSAEIKETLKRFKADNKTIKDVTALAPLIRETLEAEPYAVKVYLNELGHDYLRRLLTLQRIAGNTDKATLKDIKNIMNGVLRRGECFSLNGLALNGEDIKKLGVTDGKAIGETLRRLLDMAMRNPEINRRETLAEIALDVRRVI